MMAGTAAGAAGVVDAAGGASGVAVDVVSAEEENCGIVEENVWRREDSAAVAVAVAAKLAIFSVGSEECSVHLDTRARSVCLGGAHVPACGQRTANPDIAVGVRDSQ